MITASTRMKPAAANSAAPMPPFLTLIATSDFASAISLRISVETSRLAEATSCPIELSYSGRATADPVVVAGALSVIATPFGGAEPRRHGLSRHTAGRNAVTPSVHEPVGAAPRSEQGGEHRARMYGGLRVLGLAPKSTPTGLPTTSPA